jgi:hypothetical protein
MPPISINTNIPPQQDPPSPQRPPISPITPPLPATLLPGDNRPSFTHTQQTEQVGIPPPPPVPIDFENNPDVIALRSAISVLQVQRGRATADIQALSKIKDEATADPEAFLRDLAAGKVKSQEHKIDFSALNDDDDDDGDDEDEDGDANMTTKEPQRSWTNMPNPQNVVRAPPINWAQYAVVGESLDKIHSDQLSRPPQGAPATLAANGAYEFKGADDKRERHTGIAAPFDPLKDKVDRKSKS